MIKCQICQHDNPPGAEYCEDCGASLSASAAPAGQATPTPDAPPAAIPMPEPTPEAAAEMAEAPAPAETPESQVSTPEAGADMPVTPDVPVEAPVSSAPAPVTVPDEPQPTAGGGTPRLVPNRHGAASGDEYPLLVDRLVVGRFDPETGPVDIDLSQTPEAPLISRHHAQIYKETDGRWYVTDLGSTNGVFVKSADAATFGPRLTAPQALSGGDEVAFGNARFIFRVD